VCDEKKKAPYNFQTIEKKSTRYYIEKEEGKCNILEGGGKEGLQDEKGGGKITSYYLFSPMERLKKLFPNFGKRGGKSVGT